MKTLLIVSDTHGSKRGLETLAPLLAENDYLVHLGDGVGDVRELTAEYPDKVELCAGNCDFFSPLPQEGVLEVESTRIFYCHGHKYGVKRDLYALAQAAKAKDCTVALYGHTHIARVDEIDGVTLINPGTFRAPVEKGGSYCYLVVHKKQATPTIVGSPMQ